MLEGETVDGRFVIEHLAGSGGMGFVYRAHDAATGAPVALKVLSGAPEPGALLRFEREALALAELCHPGIVRHVAHGVWTEGRPYLAMEWVEGESLAARLQRGPLGVDDTIALGVRLADALGEAHRRGIVHRDLKPSNVLLQDGALAHPRIVDFGLAALPEATRATVTGEIVGTPEYMAPEQARGLADIDPRVDVFTLGALLHECLTGEPVFKAQHVMAVLVKIVVEEIPRLREAGHFVPKALDKLIARMLAKDPKGRPADGDAVVALLGAIGSDVDARSSGQVSTMPRGPGTLGAGERWLVSVVLARPPRGTETPDRSRTLVSAGADPIRPVLAAVEAHGGLPAVLSDGTIAVTVRGAGLATDHAALAAGCALALRDRLPGATVAIATGRAEVAAARAVGDAIERAARLIRARERAHVGAAIDLDDVTAGLLDLRFDVTASSLGLSLSGERDVAEAARTLLGKPTPFVGRRRELSTIEALFAECIEERSARAALVTAPAGVGKSRLRHEITERLASRGGVELWIARGDPMRADAAFGLAVQLVRRTARLLVGEPVAAQRQKLLARVSRHVPAAERLRVAELMGEIAGAPFPAEGRVQLRAARQDPRLLGDQVRRAFVDWLDAETAAQPVAIVLEDLHWGDAPSAHLIDAALQSLGDRPFFVLAFARPEVHDRHPRLWRDRAVQEIRLMPLARRDCERLAADVLGDRASPDTIAHVAERSHGNVFFLEELVRATAEGRGAELPETMRAMVESRLHALPPEDRRLLRAASVLGDVFWRGGLDALLGADPQRAERLAELERTEWICRRPTAKFRGEEELAFRHAIVREVAYGMLTAEDSALGHRLAAAWLEAAGETDAVVLAEHFEHGGDAEIALRWYCAAAEQAVEGNDLPAVIARVDRAVALGARGEALGRLALSRALAHNWRGEHAEAEPWAQQAVDLLPEGSARWCAAEAELIWTAGNRGDGARIAAAGDDLLGAATLAESPGALIVALAHAVTWLVGTGRYDDARSLQRSVDAAVGDLRDQPAATAAALVARAFLAQLDDDSCGLRELLLAAIARFEDAGDRRQANLQRSNLTDACNRLGAYAEAEALARTVLAEAERAGVSFAAIAVKNNLGLALVRLGRETEARRVLAEAIEGNAAARNPRQEGIAQVYLAEAHRACGDLDSAEFAVRRAASLLAAFPPYRPLSLAALASILLARGRSREALEHAAAAHEDLASLGQVEEGDVLVRLVYAEALAARGDRARSALVLDDARARLLARSARIADARLRRSFVESVPENARLIALTEA